MSIFWIGFLSGIAALVASGVAAYGGFRLFKHFMNPSRGSWKRLVRALDEREKKYPPPEKAKKPAA